MGKCIICNGPNNFRKVCPTCYYEIPLQIIELAMKTRDEWKDNINCLWTQKNWKIHPSIERRTRSLNKSSTSAQLENNKPIDPHAGMIFNPITQEWRWL